MADFLRIEWIKDPTKHADLLPMDIFTSEVKNQDILHRVEKLGRLSQCYFAKCSLQIRSNSADLTYADGDFWSAGTSRIVFHDTMHRLVDRVLWAEESSGDFEDLHPRVRLISELDQETKDEVQRLERLGKVAQRPEQTAFRVALRQLYQDQCAVTGCSTTAVLEAAHIRVIRSRKSADDNDLKNGILLRADIHALFDAGLITLTEDGSRVEVSNALSDLSYEFLNERKIFRPDRDAPSIENIRHHRKRFGYSVRPPFHVHLPD